MHIQYNTCTVFVLENISPWSSHKTGFDVLRDVKLLCKELYTKKSYTYITPTSALFLCTRPGKQMLHFEWAMSFCMLGKLFLNQRRYITKSALSF